MKVVCSIITTIILLLLIVGCGNPDSYLKTTIEYNEEDEECDIKGKEVLIKLDVYYPEGFICSTWLEDGGYFSKTKCSCYRGKPIEVVTYDRESGDFLKTNGYVKFK